jgi:hypothetical protein
MKGEFDNTFRKFRKSPTGASTEYRSRFPKWQFLSYICNLHDVVLHGSCEPGVVELEPRQANDMRAYSSQKAVYATTDGIWAIFFAILNRREYAMGLTNSCFTVEAEPGELLGPFYYFSISQHALDAAPWCTGAVYILPRAAFSQEDPRRYGGVTVSFPHWISESRVKPYGYISVEPHDFPFLGDIHGHDDDEQRRRYEENPDWKPWDPD